MSHVEADVFSPRIGNYAAMLALRCLLYVIVLQFGALLEMRAVRAEVPGDAAETAAAKQPAEKDPAKPLARLKGRVVLDSDGTPVNGAEVRLVTRRPAETIDYGNLPVRKTTTDEQGEFQFDDLAPGSHRVWSLLGQRTSQRERLQGEIITIPDSGENPAEIELRLREGAAVEVHVRSKADGQSLAGAVVHATFSDVEDVRTDDKGVAVFQPLVPDLWAIEVWADGCAKETKSIRLAPGTVAQLDIALSPGREIEGTVRDEKGNPLAGANVNVQPIEGQMPGASAFMRTDASGHYRLAHLPLTLTLQLRSHKADYLPYQSGPLRVGEKLQLDVTLSARPNGGSIRGRVIDQDVRPIANADAINRGDFDVERRQAKTDQEGHFALENLYLAPGGATVVARADGFAPKLATVKPGPSEAPSEVDVTLEPGHRLAGRVIDEQGRPLTGVSVSSGFGPLLRTETTTDAEGRFAFDSLPADTRFGFFKKGYSPISFQQLQLDREAPLTVAMSPQGMIRGKAVDAATGAPLHNFTVCLFFSPKQLPSDPNGGIANDLLNPGVTFQSADGTFELSDLMLGMPLQVSVLADGYERAVEERIVARAPGETPLVELSLSPEGPATLTTYGGRLLDARGKPVAGAELRLIAAVDRPEQKRTPNPISWSMIRNRRAANQPGVVRFVEAVSDREGRFEFPRVPRKAETELVWWGKGFAPGRRDGLERLSDAERSQIEISLEAPAKIEGRIDRKAFPNAAMVSLVHASTADFVAVQLELDQETFEFRDLAAGLYVVTLSLLKQDEQGGGPFRRMTSQPLSKVQIQLAPGEVQQLEFKQQ